MMDDKKMIFESIKDNNSMKEEIGDDTYNMALYFSNLCLNDLDLSTLEPGDLDGAVFENCEMNNIKFDIPLRDVRFENCDLNNTSFSQMQIANQYSNCDLKNTKIEDDNLLDVSFYECDLSNALVFNTHLHNVVFSKSNLESAFINCSELSGESMDIMACKGNNFNIHNSNITSLVMSDNTLYDMGINSNTLESVGLFENDIKAMNMSSNHMKSVIFDNNNMSYSQIKDSSMDLCDINRSNIENSTFSNNKIQNSCFRNLSFQEVYLRDVDFVKTEFLNNIDYEQSDIINSSFNGKALKEHELLDSGKALKGEIFLNNMMEGQSIAKDINDVELEIEELLKNNDSGFEF